MWCVGVGYAESLTGLLSRYWMCWALADKLACMTSSDTALFIAVSIVSGTIVGLFIVLVVRRCARARKELMTKQGGPKEGAPGNAPSGGQGSPALEVPTLPTKRECLGSHGDPKQPASPNRGFTEVTLPVPVGSPTSSAYTIHVVRSV